MSETTDEQRERTVAEKLHINVRDKIIIKVHIPEAY